MQGRRVLVVANADEILVYKLDPLPADSEKYLAEIVRHYLERLAPWLSDQLRYSFISAPTGEGRKLAVTAAATGRSIHEKLLTAIEALDPYDVWLLHPDSITRASIGPIRMVSPERDAEKKTRARGNVIAAATLAGALLAALLASLGASKRQAEVELEMAAREHAEIRHRLFSDRFVPESRDFAALLNRKRNSPLAVVVLEEISRAIPDDTWLNEFRITEGGVRLVGVTKNVPALIPLLEKSPVVQNASFFAPTMRLQYQARKH
jgi:general secretion pathway protein L